VNAPVDNSFITGQSQLIGYPLSGVFLGGVDIYPMDTARYSLITGTTNQYGGLAQLVSGQYLVDRTPGGAVFGNTNVDFAMLATTGTRGVSAPGMAGYPLLALGNSGNSSGLIPSNAITVLYNGRTQINTTGYTNTLTQTAATPKAALEVVSTNSGVLFPKLTMAQVAGIASADLLNGLLLYNTDSSAFQFYNGSSWGTMSTSVNAGSGGWANSGNTATNSSNNFIGTIDSTTLSFRTNDMTRANILASGAVGVGTSVLPGSDAQLAVNGTVYASKIFVTLTGWPDYVFGNSYSLPSLADVARYIGRYRHLPGMPSAGETAAKGIDLGANEAAILKKIEELTLYLIDADKQSKVRQEKIDRLKDRNKCVSNHQLEIDQLKELLLKLAARK
jgi:hypothetical protein